MAARGLTLNLTARTAWWVPLYLRGMAFFCALMGTEPNWDKVEKVVLKGVRLKINAE